MMSITRHNITKEEYLRQDSNYCMTLLIKNGIIQQEIDVPAQITPSTIYNAIMIHTNNIDHCLEPLSWQCPKQLQVAVLTMFELSYLFSFKLHSYF